VLANAGENIDNAFNIDPAGLHEAATMSDVLRFLDSSALFSNGESEYVIMRLPENSSFSNYGSPQVKNAATYPPPGRSNGQ
jgi:hypothetical protein